jgi:hypothetical protein
MELRKWLEGREGRRRAKQALIGSVVITLLLYFIPFGRMIAYPLMLLSTLVHELGHGLVALGAGHDFKSLVIYPDGSGVAQHSGPSSPVRSALISAGGLVGPAIAAAVGFIVGRYEKASRYLLGGSAVFLAAIMGLFVRNGFGLVFTGLLVVGLGWVVWKKPHRAQLLLVFLATQLSLSVFSRGDYLFTDTAMTGSGPMPSDVEHMAQALGGPYWLWGLACGAFSVLVLAGGIWWFWRVFDQTKPSR